MPETPSLQTISSIVVILSAIAGAIWAVFRFTILRAVKKAIEVKIEETVSKGSGESVIVLVSIRLTNTGTVPIWGNIPNNPKCLLTVKRLDGATGNARIMESESPNLLDPIAYLEYYDGEEPFVLEPGVPCEVRGFAYFVTDYKGPLLLLAEFVDNTDTWWHDAMIIDTRSVA